jgi:hypothetical protein
VTGTVVGSDGTNQIGVAPGAQWFGARSMEYGNGTPETYIACWEFFIAPTNLDGNNPDPSRAPHVIVNSTYCPGPEGCDPSSLHDIVRAVRAAGILYVTAAGNNGPDPGTIMYAPMIYREAVSVGAFESSGIIASFSSRGPTTYGGETYLKPDVAAPGRDVRSCVPGGTYALKSGTSMASPHCGGTAVLMLEAAPYLRGDPERAAWHLTRSAVPVIDFSTPGGDDDGHPNTTWGWGKVNALNAVNGALDDDGDGYTNLEEQVAGTNASDPDDYLRITSVTASGDDVAITWTSVPGETYSLFSTTDPPDAAREWTLVQDAIAAEADTDTTYVHVGALVGTSALHYRVMVEETD